MFSICHVYFIANTNVAELNRLMGSQFSQAWLIPTLPRLIDPNFPTLDWSQLSHAWLIPTLSRLIDSNSPTLDWSQLSHAWLVPTLSRLIIRSPAAIHVHTNETKAALRFHTKRKNVKVCIIFCVLIFLGEPDKI
jgi:hypothetical protein